MTDNSYLIFATIVVFVITLVFGVLPYKRKNAIKPKLWVNLLNAFTGGMFLSIGLIHIFPEAQELYNTKNGK